ncbi:MAG: hypothetical protein D6B28_09355 [Gammaproteobacteria bacterium]|nr:MAG: hypothetical protein D6B28_09355 [Gammaproteobacteria bacterium]
MLLLVIADASEMVELSGYTNLKEIMLSNGFSVFRAQRESDNLNVFIKVLDAGRVTIEIANQFNNEFKRLSDFDFEGVIKPLAMESIGEYKVMVFEDHGFAFLNEAMLDTEINIEEALVIANNLIVAIGELHSWQIVHGKICPRDILYDPETKNVMLFGAGIFDTSFFWEKDPEWKKQYLYVSPEVKQLTNHRPDYRTDYYSFGVIVHELLAGFLPFYDDCIDEYTSQNILAESLFSAQNRPAKVQIPNVIADIVRKLLALEPLDRYQSVWGINADLEQCVDQLRARGKIYHFPLARHDVSSQFAIPEKLYGRETEVRQLMDTYSRVSKGTKEVIAISGDPGIGKTSIVAEIKGTIERRNGTFISGNFDSNLNDISDGAIINAIRSFIKDVVLADASQIDYWHDLLVDVLGHNAKVLIEVIPELERVIGYHGEPEELEPLEAKNRFNFMLQTLIQVISSERTPLVLFLDNFHLAGSATADFIFDLLTNCETNYLMVVLAYRKKELQQREYLKDFCLDLESQGEKVKELELNHLSLQNISQLIVDALYSDKGEVAALARLVETKTKGNPLFIDEFLKTLFSEQMIYFDSNQGKWHWDLKEIQSRDSFDNVIDFVAGRIVRMGEQFQRLLTVAAVIGSNFDINLLSKVLKNPLIDVYGLLNDLKTSGLIYEIDGEKQDVVDGAEAVNIAVNYRFSHDMVRYSVQTLLSPQAMSKLHNEIGVELLEEDVDHSLLFEITNQLNAGAVISTLNVEESKKLIDLNIRAAERAIKINAYRFAQEYLAFAIKVLGINGWSQSYQLTVNLHLKLLRCLYLNNSHSEMIMLSDQIISKVSLPIDRAKIYEVIMDAYIKKQDLVKASDYLLTAINQFGMEVNDKPNKFRTFMLYMLIKRKLNRKDISFIENLPPMDDPAFAECLRIAVRGSVALYFTKPETYAYTVLKGGSAILKHGLTQESPLVLTGLATLFFTMSNDDIGYQLGKVSLSLAKKLGRRDVELRARYLNIFFIMRSKLHIKESLPHLESIFNESKEIGDFEFGSLALVGYASTALIQGTTLNALKEKIERQLHLVKRFGIANHIRIYQMILQVVHNLLGTEPKLSQLIGKEFNEQVQKPALIMSGDRAGLFFYHLHKVTLLYMEQDFIAALEEVDELEKHLGYVSGFYETVFYDQFDSLIRLSVYAAVNVSRSEQKAIIKKVRRNQKRLAKWCKFSPENNQHKYDLVEAELNRVLGNELKAINLYGQSIENAKKNGFINEQAMANEIAARFYMQTGKTRMAEVHMQAAHALYKEWESQAMVVKLEDRYGELINSEVFS